MCLFKILLMYGRREHDGALCLSSITMRELQGGKITKESKVGKQRKEIHSRQQLHQTHSISFPFVPFPNSVFSSLNLLCFPVMR